MPLTCSDMIADRGHRTPGINWLPIYTIHFLWSSPWSFSNLPLHCPLTDVTLTCPNLLLLSWFSSWVNLYFSLSCLSWSFSVMSAASNVLILLFQHMYSSSIHSCLLINPLIMWLLLWYWLSLKLHYYWIVICLCVNVRWLCFWLQLFKYVALSVSIPDMLKICLPLIWFASPKITGWIPIAVKQFFSLPGVWRCHARWV
jgi:hypothetical protein